MAITTTRNPVLRDDTYSSQAQGPFLDTRSGSGLPGDTPPRTMMSIRGVIGKAAILLLLVAFSFGYTWDRVMEAAENGGAGGGSFILIGGIGGFIVSLIISFKPKLAPFLAPPFALLEGLLLGAISAYYESASVAGGYDGIVFQAALATIGVFTAMLLLYRTRIIKVTARFRAIVGVAMLGIVITYGLTFILSFFGTTVPFIHGSGPIGIGFSLLVIGIASMMLLSDFDMVERGVATGAPKYMEWYSAFALLVTVVWIYLEMLRLLSKLRR
ncbi:MAG: Bax1 inhibitor-like family protein [Thermoleophilia bacterium]|nr:Bax1 inhibitor-like family protein [Thermoleophilia bacterium]